MNQEEKNKKTLIDINSVVPSPSNPREISPKDFESLKKKIERWKKCSCCKEIKSILGNFYSDKSRKDGLNKICNDCSKVKQQRWAKTHKELKNSLYRNWYIENKEKKIQQVTVYRSNPQAKHIRNIRNRVRRNDDIRFKISSLLSSKFSSALKDRKVNSEHCFSNLSYSVGELISHLEHKFKEGMTWQNYGKYWHIDHIKPVSWFKYTSPDDKEFKMCWALSNLQPLEKHANLSKQNRYEG